MDDQTRQATGLNTRARLSRISHHFLSEDEQRGATDAPLFFVTVPPIHAERPCALPLAALAGELVRSGHAVATENEGNGGLSLRYPRTAPGADAHGFSRTGPARDIRRLLEDAPTHYPPRIVLTTHRPASAGPDDLSVALIAVPADTDGMREAFVRLKELAADRPRAPSVVGVTVCGVHDPAQAGRAFDRFARAAHDFLSLTVTSYGCIVRGGGVISLGEVTSLLLEDWRVWQDRRRAENAERTHDHPHHHHSEQAHEPSTETGTADAR